MAKNAISKKQPVGHSSLACKRHLPLFQSQSNYKGWQRDFRPRHNWFIEVERLRAHASADTARTQCQFPDLSMKIFNGRTEIVHKAKQMCGSWARKHRATASVAPLFIDGLEEDQSPTTYYFICRNTILNRRFGKPWTARFPMLSWSRIKMEPELGI